MKKCIIAILTLFFLLFVFEQVFGTNQEHINRGKTLYSLSKYDNNKTYRSFVRSRVGFQPVITMLPQGASLSASAVVSGDRRYVRIGLTPFFSTIGNVDTFNFGKR